MKQKELETLLLNAKTAYYNSDTPILSDEEYDYYENLLKKNYPKSKVLKLIGANIDENVSNKIKLPYWMGSMTKLKETKDINNWIKKYSGNYVITDKLDGISALYDTNKHHLYTRGNGEYGTNISHVLQYININLKIKKNHIIRGELIIKKDTFNTKYKDTYSNARNLVSGIINSKKINKSILKDIDFVAYELLYPENIKIEEQLYIISKLNVDIVSYTIIDKLITENLKTYLEYRKNNSIYEIDGIVIKDNNQYNLNTSGNPDYAFAFKTLDINNIKEAEVLDIEWNISKHGYLKPKIKIKPIIINDVRISNVTGFNAKYIVNNNINKGTILNITRSGDVIPHIVEIVKASNKPLLPDIDFKWTDSNVDIYITGKNKEHEIKYLVDIFKKLNTKGLAIGVITNLYDNGYTTFESIIKLNPIELNKLDGFQETLSNKIYTSIQQSIQNIDLLTLMDISNVFGRGFGKKKLALILDTYPNILEINDNLIEKISNIKGYNIKTATQFVNNLDMFKKFKTSLNIKLKEPSSKKVISNIPKKYLILKNKNIVFTGFRDKELEQIIIQLNGNIQSNINAKTDILLVKDLNLTNTKTEKAKKLNIKIMIV
tara:strand:- start:22 stop:1833 length:1812 start_codon:yes stop_codon:yes gene_type:complete